MLKIKKRTLTNPADFAEIKDMYFAIDETPELSNVELMELQQARERSQINQAR